jgi:hypothetical protein
MDEEFSREEIENTVLTTTEWSGLVVGC